MKNKFAKFVYILIDLVIVTGIIIFMYFNMDKSVTYFCPLMQKTFSANLSLFVLGIFSLAYLAGYAFCSIINTRLNDICNAYQKRHENISIENESDKARIETLEAKISTLEAALKAALENK